MAAAAMEEAAAMAVEMAMEVAAVATGVVVASEEMVSIMDEKM